MKIIVNLLIIIATALAVALLIAYPVMWLWNWLMPEIFGLSTLSVWQSLGLLLLSTALFKSSSTRNNN